jgi:hypothetical protein
MMSAFTPAEIKYLQSQRLGRIATVRSDGRYHLTRCRVDARERRRTGMRANPDSACSSHHLERPDPIRKGRNAVGPKARQTGASPALSYHKSLSYSYKLLSKQASSGASFL